MCFSEISFVDDQYEFEIGQSLTIECVILNGYGNGGSKIYKERVSDTDLVCAINNTGVGTCGDSRVSVVSETTGTTTRVTVTLANTTCSDAGEYLCKADNDDGLVTSMTLGAKRKFYT